jgi:hypothetical protein
MQDKQASGSRLTLDLCRLNASATTSAATQYMCLSTGVHLATYLLANNIAVGAGLNNADIMLSLAGRSSRCQSTGRCSVILGLYALTVIEVSVKEVTLDRRLTPS